MLDIVRKMNHKFCFYFALQIDPCSNGGGPQWRELMAVLLDNPARSSSLTACVSTAWSEKVELMMIWRSSHTNQTNWRHHLSHVTEHMVISIFISVRPGWFVFVILHWVQRFQFRIQFLYRFWFKFDSNPWLAFRSASIQSTNWQNQVPTLYIFFFSTISFTQKYITIRKERYVATSSALQL